MFKGFENRFYDEIANLSKSGATIKVSASENRSYNAWVGASKLTPIL